MYSRALSYLALSLCALVWIIGTGGCGSKTGTSAPTQQPALSEPMEPAEPAEPTVPGEPSENCGGLTGLACDSGKYCHYEPDQMCGAADQLGVCRTIPDFCTEQYDPVCGCDDATYSNSCKANAAGVSVATSEPCPQQP